MTYARMPQAWVASDTESKAETAWPVPADPCQPPDVAGPLHGWDGFTIIELSEAPCLPGSATGKALYLELIHPCLADCGEPSGYRLWPAECHMGDGGEVVPTGPWRVNWQDSLVGAAHCTEGAMWGRLERMVLSSGCGGWGWRVLLRLHALAQGHYIGTQAEVLVSVLAGDQFLEVPIKTAEGPVVSAEEVTSQFRRRRHQNPMVVSVEPSISGSTRQCVQCTCSSRPSNWRLSSQ